MITIKKSTQNLINTFRVRYTGSNGENLCTSEPLKTKQAAFKNILAVAKQFPLNTEDTQLLLVQDDTGKKAIKKYLNLNTGAISNL